MKKPRRLFSVFAGCFTFFLIGTAFAVRADEKNDLEKKMLAEKKKIDARIEAEVNTLIAKEKADPNDAKSLYELGVRCWNGNDAEKDLTAVELYRRAAEMGYADAQYAYGMAYLELLKEIMPRAAAKAEGVKWLRKAADQGHEKAQLAIARCYLMGEGVKQDSAEAFKIYREMADAGSAGALYELHACYWVGYGVEKDRAKAAEVLRKSAEMGYVEAQSRLGFYYQRGNGDIPVDLHEAVKWYTLAAAQGDSGSKANLERLKDLIPLLETAEKGNAEAQYKLARYFIEHNDIGDPDPSVKSREERIRKWLLKAAENGHVTAQLDLAEAYAHFEIGIWWIARKKDFAEAAKWYRKAADLGDPMGQGMLGWLYATGRGVDKDLKTAVEWFRTGAAQGNAEAQFGMGVSLQESWLEPYNEEKDWKTVVDWYVKAADSGLKHFLPELENTRDYTVELQCKIAELYRSRYNLALQYKDEPADRYLAEAVKWYRKAAEAHDEYGLYKLQELAENDCKEAKEALRTLAKNGNEMALEFIEAGGWDEPEEEKDGD